MSDLREAVGRMGGPTPYSILIPPGWRRVPASVLSSADLAAPAMQSLRAAGRADLVLQLRSTMARLQSSLRESRVFEAYLPPAVDGVMLPASLTVSPFVLPSQTDWTHAVARMAKGSQVDRPEGVETPMYLWRRNELLPDAEKSLVGRSTHYVVPVDEPDTRRALIFHLTVLVADDTSVGDAVDVLEGIGDLMMATMRWVPRPE